MISTGLVSFLSSTVIGGIFKLISTKFSHSMRLREAELKAMNAKAAITKDAREYDNTGFQWTRRFITIAAVLSIIVLPLWAPVYYSIMYPVEIAMLDKNPLPVWFGYDVVTQGWWPFGGSTTETMWREFKGIVITPFHVEIMSAIMGLYFGSRLGNGKM